MNHKHRGRSHFPLWGTFERLLYLSLFVAPSAIFVGLQAPDDVAEHSEGMAANGANGGLSLCAAAIGGVELAALWHLCCDYVWPLKKF